MNKIYLRKTSKEDWLLATAIAQRGYDEEVQKRAEKELKIIDNLITLYEQGTVEEVYGLLSWQRQRLITPIRLTDEQYAEQWQAQEYRRKQPADDAVLLETARGELVNSKSEVFIADRLKDRRRPYFYEFPVELVDHLTGKPYTAHPDFYVLNPRTRKSYYWEHFGRCDDPGYVNDNINKLIDYQNAGIIPGINLIMTFETKTIPFVPAMADKVIDDYLM